MGESRNETFRPTRLNEMLNAFGDELTEMGAHVDLVVVGGFALAAQGLLLRPTQDIDVLARLVHGHLVSPNPLPRKLLSAESRVMDEFGLDHEFLDPWVPEQILAFGALDGMLARSHAQAIGSGLTVHVVSRFDLICLKCIAISENKPDRAKHEADLRALEPTTAELRAACVWAEHILYGRIQRAQMLLQEQLLRDGSRDAAELRLLSFRHDTMSARDQFGAWLIRRPRWCGRTYSAAVGLAGQIKRAHHPPSAPTTHAS